jgi:antitoxin ParD1/3/4
MNISLPDDLKEYVEQQTQRGYGTASKYVQELILEDQKRQAKKRIDDLLLEGVDSGDSVPADAAYWTEIRREGADVVEARKRSGR